MKEKTQLKERSSSQQEQSIKETNTIGLQFNYLIPSMGKSIIVCVSDCVIQLTDNLDCLSDVQVAEKKLFLVQGDKPQLMNWEQFGLRIGIEEDSLLSSETVEVATAALVGGQFKFPENTVLVSAVYAVSVSEPLLKPLRLEIQHCVDLRGQPGLSQYLKFAIAPVSTPSLPYQFSLVEGGKFTSNSWYGAINRKDFCLVCILGLIMVTTITGGGGGGGGPQPVQQQQAQPNQQQVQVQQQQQPGEVPQEPQQQPGEVLQEPQQQPGEVPQEPQQQPGEVPQDPQQQPGEVPQEPQQQPGEVPQEPQQQPGEVPQDPQQQPGEVPQEPQQQPGEVPQEPQQQPGEVPQEPQQQPGEVPQEPQQQPGEVPQEPQQQPGEEQGQEVQQKDVKGRQNESRTLTESESGKLIS